MEDPVTGSSDGLDDARVVVADRAADLATGEVEDPVALAIPDPAPAGPLDEERGEAGEVADQVAVRQRQ
jgi:hypothetical protein